MVTTRTFDQQTGTIDTIKAGVNDAVADFSYAFDSIGNLTARGDANMAVTESFTYDVLNRVTVYGVTNTGGTVTKTMVYNEIGNILSKSDVGTYTYAATGNALPHAVASISGTVNTTYTYDGNGNMLTGKGRTLTWTAANMVASIVEGANTVTFLYDAEQSRAKKTDSNGTTYYYSGAGIKVEKVVGATLTTWNEYLYAGGEIIGQHYSKSDLSTYTYYFVNDHLGSIAVITDELGTVTERLSYDAWGKRRNSDGSDATTPIVSATMLGFTGHEMIDDVGLVNMNGRIYDPTIGRFMSADPFVDDVFNGKSLNRYSYVWNNPLSYTDPSGFGFFSKIGKFFKKVFKAIKKFIRPIIAIAAAVALSVYLGPILVAKFGTILGSALTGGISGGISGFIATGSPKSLLTGFAQGFALGAVGGSIFKVPSEGFASFGQKAAFYGKKALVHGVIGGTASAAGSGKFGRGFLASGFSALAGIKTFGSDTLATAYHAVVGGAGSVLGGGKFADGAVSGAFGYLFNECSTRRCFRANLEIEREVWLPYSENDAVVQIRGEVSRVYKDSLATNIIEVELFLLDLVDIVGAKTRVLKLIDLPVASFPLDIQSGYKTIGLFDKYQLHTETVTYSGWEYADGTIDYVKQVNRTLVPQEEYRWKWVHTERTVTKQTKGRTCPGSCDFQP